MIIKKYLVLVNVFPAQYKWYFFVIFFIIGMIIRSVFIYFHWYFKRKYIETTIYWMPLSWTYKWEINIKNGTYYFSNDMIDIKNFYWSLMKVGKRFYKNISIYNIGYITIEKIDDYENIISVNPFYQLLVKQMDKSKKTIKTSTYFLLLQIVIQKY